MVIPEGKTTYSAASRPKIVVRIRISREAQLFLNLCAKHDQKFPGDLIEEWARKGYAWRQYAYRVVEFSQQIDGFLKKAYEWELYHDGPATIAKIVEEYGSPFYRRPYYYGALFLDSYLLKLARAALYIDDLILPAFIRIKSFYLAVKEKGLRRPHIKISITFNK